MKQKSTISPSAAISACRAPLGASPRQPYPPRTRARPTRNAPLHCDFKTAVRLNLVLVSGNKRVRRTQFRT